MEKRTTQQKDNLSLINNETDIVFNGLSSVHIIFIGSEDAREPWHGEGVCHEKRETLSQTRLQVCEG